MSLLFRLQPAGTCVGSVNFLRSTSADEPVAKLRAERCQMSLRTWTLHHSLRSLIFVSSFSWTFSLFNVHCPCSMIQLHYRQGDCDENDSVHQHRSFHLKLAVISNNYPDDGRCSQSYVIEAGSGNFDPVDSQMTNQPCFIVTISVSTGSKRSQLLLAICFCSSIS